MTRRLDPGAGWYGEFLRRDPGGVRACLEGVAIPPWDVLESLLGDLPGDPGSRAREAAHAAGLRTAAVAAWDAMPGGGRELRLQLDVAAGQWAASEAALRSLTDRLGGTADPGEAAALARELAWTRDDTARAAARHADLTTRLRALPLAGVPRQRERQPEPGPDREWRPEPGPDRDREWRPEPGPDRDREWRPEPGPDRDREWRPEPEPGPDPDRARHQHPEPPLQPLPDREPWPEPPLGPDREWRREAERDPEPGPEPESPSVPVGRAEGRWLRGARRAGGARYAGAPPAAAVAAAPTAPLPAPRGARFAGGATA
ncbi:hypothetical protein ACEPPI_35165, partial [Streptomyces sp. AB3(2024)]